MGVGDCVASPRALTAHGASIIAISKWVWRSKIQGFPKVYVLKGGSGSKPGLHMRFGEGGSIQTREEKAKEIM